MKKCFSLWTLSFFLMVMPFFAVSPTTLFGITTNDNGDTDATIAAIELRTCGRVMTKEGFPHFGDIDMPGDDHTAFVTPSVTLLQNVPLSSPLFFTKVTTKIRAPPTSNMSV